MGSPKIVTSIKTIGSSSAWSLLKGNQINLKEKDADIQMLPAAPSTRDKRQSVMVLINTPADRENAVYRHKRVVLFYREHGACVLSGQ